MRKVAVAVALIALMLGGAPSQARAADCSEDQRRLAFSSTDVVNLKAFNCSSGADTFRVEFHRFAEAAASLIVAKRQTKAMRQAFGTPKLIENDVFRTYADLLQKFGATVQLSGDINNASNLSIRNGAGDNASTTTASANDTLPSRTIRQILGSEGLWGADYPAFNEITALRRKTIPNGLKFKYSATCRDAVVPDAPVDVECRDFDLGTAKMTFWRPFRGEDADDYAKHVGSFNRALAQFKTELRARNRKLDLEQGPMRQVDLSNKLKFFKHLSGNSWPDDFIILHGEQQDACGTDTVAGIDGWVFTHSGRNIFLDAILLENTSKRPLRIAGLFGSQISEPALRRAEGSGSGDASVALTETLAPGQRILLPVKIHLESADRTQFETRKQSKSLFDRLGMNGFKGTDTGHALPDLPDYTYGPELRIRAFLVNDARVDLERQASNFIDLSVSPEIGSCPYLLSWDAKSREWLDHGKVLHKAPSQAREYTDTRTVEGFVSRYRIEEREAEVAFIDQAALVVSLANGREITLAPDHAALAQRDGHYQRLAWDEAVEINFVLPQAIAEDDVVESRLEITGYYLRYSELQARGGVDAPAIGGRVRRAGPIVIPTERANAPMCPTPPRFSPLQVRSITAG